MHIQNPNRNVLRMILKIYAYESQNNLLPESWEIEHIFPRKWQTNYFPDDRIPESVIREKIEHIGNKTPFEKKLNIVAGNGYFSKKKKEYAKSSIAITKAIGTSKEITDWDMDSITRRDIRISDAIISIIKRRNTNYLNQSKGTLNKPSEEDLMRIEEFKKNGWI